MSTPLDEIDAEAERLDPGHLLRVNAELRQRIARCVAAVETMPDFAGRTARPDGLTHRCEECGEWMAEGDTKRDAPSGSLRHDRPEYNRSGVPGYMICGPVNNLGPVEGLLRSDVIATLRRVLLEDR